MRIVLVGRDGQGKDAAVIRPSGQSRYSRSGRQKIARKLRRRMGGFWSAPGLLLTLTYDPKLISRDQAWAQYSADVRSLLNTVNVWRKRRGMAKLSRLWVLEEQSQTGYPHVHVVFPRLRWLAPLDSLITWWGQARNSVDLKVKDGISPTSYVCKYVAKLDGWSEAALAEIWDNGTRLYAMSRDFTVVPDERPVSRWCRFAVVRASAYETWVPALVGNYKSVVGANDLIMAYFKGQSEVIRGP